MLLTHPEFLSPAELDQINDLSLRLLENVGVDFPVEKARDLLQKRGARVSGTRVCLPRTLVEESLRQAPHEFPIYARNPEKSIMVGGDRTVFAPGYGAPFLMDSEVGARTPTIQDYDNIVRIADALPNQDLSGHLMINPRDIPADTAHLRMLLSSMIHSDKPFIGSSNGLHGAQASIEMAGILFDGQDSLKQKPVMISLINTLSPLAFAAEMIEALMFFAEWRQPIVIAAMAQAGATAPVSLAGMLTQVNAELLAGVTLAQVVNPGTPVVYGSTSTVMDMATAAAAIGAPEYPVLVSCHAQLARYYGLPCRSGGSLTDSQIVDAQAGMESMMDLLTTVSSGINFVLHSGGILGSYLTFSIEKFVMDDEICGMVRRYMQGVKIDDGELAYDVIAEVGPGGNYLMHDHTMARFRKAFYRPFLCSRDALPAWEEKGSTNMVQRANARWKKLLANHVIPAPDAGAEKALRHYVESHL